MKKGRSYGAWAGFFVLLAVLSLGIQTKVSAKTISVTTTTANGGDITEELQDALDITRDSTDSVSITIPEGQYVLSQMLRIYGDTTISMNGVTLSRLAPYPITNGVMMRFGRNEDQNSGYNGYANVTIVGGTWNGGEVNTSIFRLGHANNVTFENITFTNVKESHYVEMAACSNVTIRGCTFSQYKGDRKESLEALQFDILEDGHFSGYNNYDETPCKDILVENCVFTDLSRGLGTHNAYVGSYHTNIQILNNTFQNITGYAVTTFNWKDSKINGNVISGCGSGITFRSINGAGKAFYVSNNTVAGGALPANTEICGNTITLTETDYLKGSWGNYNDLAGGILLFGDVLNADKPLNESGKTGIIPKGDYTTRKVTIQGNKIELGVRGLAICLNGAKENTVKDNTITCNITALGTNKGMGDGIRLSGSSSNIIKNNTITNKTAKGPAADMNGISISDGSAGNTVWGNKISGTSLHGIVVKNSQKNKIVKNTIENIRKTAGMGIQVTKKSSNTTIDGNTIRKSKSEGICVADYSKKVKVTNNKIQNCNDYGLLVKDYATVTESKNKISKCKSALKKSGRHGKINGKENVVKKK